MYLKESVSPIRREKKDSIPLFIENLSFFLDVEKKCDIFVLV
jgi:hypothetical protein